MKCQPIASPRRPDRCGGATFVAPRPTPTTNLPRGPGQSARGLRASANPRRKRGKNRLADPSGLYTLRRRVTPMSRCLNRATLIGHLGADPEIRTLPGGGRVAHVALATTRRWNDRRREAAGEDPVAPHHRVGQPAQHLRASGMLSNDDHLGPEGGGHIPIARPYTSTAESQCSTARNGCTKPVRTVSACMEG
jgi:hypothetical protein